MDEVNKLTQRFLKKCSTGELVSILEDKELDKDNHLGPLNKQLVIKELMGRFGLKSWTPLKELKEAIKPYRSTTLEFPNKKIKI